jgi:hypothetical protein
MIQNEDVEDTCNLLLVISDHSFNSQDRICACGRETSDLWKKEERGMDAAVANLMSWQAILS